MSISIDRLMRRDMPLDRWLRWSLSLSDKVASVFSFTAVVGYKLGVYRHFTPDGRVDLGIESLKSFLWQAAWPVALAAVTLIWFMRYKSAVRNEMEILFSCFSRLNPLPDWGALFGSRYVPLLALGMTLTFLLLGYLVDQIAIYAVVVLVMNVMDVRGNSVIRRNLTLFFADARFKPLPDDPSGEFVLRRRAVAEHYWIARPQIERIGLFMIAMVVAIFLLGANAIPELPSLPPSVPRKELAYIIVMAAILMNTGTMAYWRKRRDDDLRAIDRDEAAALEERVRT